MVSIAHGLLKYSWSKWLRHHTAVPPLLPNARAPGACPTQPPRLCMPACQNPAQGAAAAAAAPEPHPLVDAEQHFRWVVHLAWSKRGSEQE